jgi:hypothetical protein
MVQPDPAEITIVHGDATVAVPATLVALGGNDSPTLHFGDFPIVIWHDTGLDVEIAVKQSGVEFRRGDRRIMFGAEKHAGVGYWESNSGHVWRPLPVAFLAEIIDTMINAAKIVAEENHQQERI